MELSICRSLPKVRGRKNPYDGVTRSSVGGAPMIEPHDLSPELVACAVLSEPGWMSNADALYLSIAGIQINPRENRIIQLSCVFPCPVTEPAEWRYVAKLLLNEDARTLGFDRYSAPDLFTSHEANYLRVSPGSDNPFPDSYNGFQAFRFADLAKDVLQLDVNGRALPALTLNGLAGTFNGACALHPAAGDQAFYSQLMTSAQDVFQIFRAPASACFSADKLSD